MPARARGALFFTVTPVTIADASTMGHAGETDRMKVMQWSALACASVLLVAGGLQGRQVERRLAPSKPATVLVNAETAEVTLTLATLPVSAEISQGENF